jgi:hypothetical protein
VANGNQCVALSSLHDDLTLPDKGVKAVHKTVVTERQAKLRPGSSEGTLGYRQCRSVKPSFRHGLPESSAHGCVKALTVLGFWTPAIPAGVTRSSLT